MLRMGVCRILAPFAVRTSQVVCGLSTSASPYPSYVSITPFQKAALAVGSSIVAFLNPKRADMVAVLGETTGECALKEMRRRMAVDPVGRQILEEKPRVRESNVGRFISSPLPDHSLKSLFTLPKNSFGRAYAEWMRQEGNFTPDERPAVRFITDPELAYVMARYREVHDFWHVLLGLPTTVLSEIAVKWVEFLHTGLPMCALSSLVGPLRLSVSEMVLLGKHYIPWAVDCGRHATFMLNIYYEKHFEESLPDLRVRFGIPPPPVHAGTGTYL